MSGSPFETVIGDLIAEARDLAAMLEGRTANDFAAMTPAEGWDVADQIVHLGLFDRRCAWSIADPEKFVADRAELGRRGGLDQIHADARQSDPAALVQWWREGFEELKVAANGADPRARCEWYGPSMSVMSMLTARLMETWPHGYDIADARSDTPVATDRLFHVALIAVRARPFAYAINGLQMPERDVRVELTAPSGAVWTWGPEGDGSASSDGDSVVRGSALGFCLAATQRRHLNDCGLEIIGDDARQWMSIIQAFAGAPGPGRQEGQFSKF